MQKNVVFAIETEVLQTSSFQFSVGSLQYKERVLLKTKNQKLYTTGLFAKVLLKLKKTANHTFSLTYHNA